MARRDLALGREPELAHPAALAPLLEQQPNGARPTLPRRPLARFHGTSIGSRGRSAITSRVIELLPRVAQNATVMDPAAITQALNGTLAALLGIRFVDTSPERVIAELAIRDDLRTTTGPLHGGRS